LSVRLTPSIWKRILQAAKTRNLEVDITLNDAYSLLVEQNHKCALTGVDISFADTSKEHNTGKTTASLDRIDSSKGYIKGNIQWVHKIINMMKRSSSQDEFKLWCRLVVVHNQKMLKNDTTTT
jgi:hypothetical protein